MTGFLQSTSALLLAVSLTGAQTAFAQDASSENTTSVKMSDLQKPDEKLPDIDNEITNAKLRAESGSKSKFSIQANVTFNGGNLERPLGEIRPNYSGISTQDARTSLSTDLNVAYKMTKNDRLSVGTGMSIATPFQATLNDVTNSSDKKTKTTNVSNPYLSYSHVMRVGSAQNVFSAAYTEYTNSNYTTANYQGNIDLSHTILFDIKHSGWQPGINTEISNNTFTDGSASTDTLRNPNSGRTDYSVAFNPFVEYAFTDKVSFRTVFRALILDHYRNDQSATFYKELYTQSVGVGVAVSRDVFVYPNLQFAPSNMSTALTNVGVASTINLF